MKFLKIVANVARLYPAGVIKARYFRKYKKWPKIKRPLSEQESLWFYIVNRELENRNNQRWAIMSDKYGAREEVDKILGPGHLIPLLGHWDNPEDIDFDSLPKSFIFKTNNGCGTNIFVHDKDKADRSAIIRQLRKSLDFPYAELTGQLHYANIKPCVVAEDILIQDGGRKSLTDYKIHCVNGEPVTLYVFKDRDEDNHFDFNMQGYTTNWRAIKPNVSPSEVINGPEAPGRPDFLEDLLDAARKLAAGEEYVRVDLYYTHGNVYFGEMTYTPDTKFHRAYADYQPAMEYVLDRIKADASR